MSNFKLRSMSKDFLLNLLASFVATAVLQLVIYPMLAKQMDSEVYGVLLTIIGLANTFAATIGSSLNNTRLLLNSEYEEKSYSGDYLPILYVTNLIAAGVLIVILQRFHGNPIANIILIAYMIANSIRTYGTVAYRIKINYTKNLICNILVAVGDLVGLGIIFVTKSALILWPITFLVGEILAIIYIIYSSDIFAEKIRKTPLFGRTINKNCVLMTTTLTANLLIYLDRLFLLPILGGDAVTTYTVASVFGKSLGILMAPLAGVLLSYFSQKDFKMDKKGFHIFNLVNICVAFLFMIVSHFISYWFTGIFYPEAIEEAKLFLDIANAAAITIVLGNMTQPTVLRYAPSYWLLIIQFVYCVSYMVGGLLVVGRYGLMGFSVVALGAAALKVVIQLLVGNMYIGEKNIDT